MLKFIDKLYNHLQESLLTVLNSEMNENTSQELTEIVETLSTIYNIDPSNKKDVEIVVKV